MGRSIEPQESELQAAWEQMYPPFEGSVPLFDDDGEPVMCSHPECGCEGRNQAIRTILVSSSVN